MDERTLRNELLRLESALARRDPTGIDGGLTSLIADDFLEFGRSGRTWTADSIREVLDGPTTSASIEAFEVAELAEGVVLATYVTLGPPATSVTPDPPAINVTQDPPATNRSSIWVRRDGRWVLRFHQGTTRPETGAKS